MSNDVAGREPIQIVEIQQPLCSLTFGVSPCTATGTADTKCYNTRATCQDPENYTLGTPLSLYFTKTQFLPTLQENQRAPMSDPSDWILNDGTWDDGGIWYDTSIWKDSAGTTPILFRDPVQSSYPKYVFPSLVSVSTSPTRINLAGSNVDAQGLGNRALCQITFQDHQHTDKLVDPYVAGRSWDPLSKDRGSFWTRWLVRNKYRQNVVIKIYEGYAGEALSSMTVRQYFLEKVSGPDDQGRVVISGKDVLARIEERKAQAPLASPGELYAGINASVTSFEVANAVEADYASSGTIRIGDEFMTYTGRSTSTNGITFTGVIRGTDNSTAASHSAEGAVQQCLRYTTAQVDTVLEDLLTTYGNVPSAFLDTSNWADEVTSYLAAYRLTTLISEPTAVSVLVSQLQEQALFFTWWDERDALVKLKAIRGIDAQPPTLTDSAHLISGSVSITEKPRERVSQSWVYYNQDDFTGGANQPQSYASQFVLADLESETDELYGEASIRKVFGRWLPTDALAQNTASKIIVRYVDVPSQIKFRLDAKDRNYWIGDVVKISHYLDVDQFGERRIRNWTIISADEVVHGEVVEYLAEDTTLYGTIRFIMASGAADYPGYDAAPFKNCYIGNAAGLLSDGEQAGTIS